MRCSTLLCGAPAEYTHRVTKEKKCNRCKNQRGDGWSLAWEKIAEEEEKETFTPYIAEKQYKIFEVEGGKYIVSDKEEEHNIFASSESEAMLMASALNNDIIGALIKAKNASNSENVVLELNSGIAGDLQLDFIFNGDVEYANKVTYTIKEITSKTSIGFNLKYSSELLKQIFVNNKGADLGKLFLNSNGLMKLVFEYKDLKSTYYVVAKEI